MAKLLAGCGRDLGAAVSTHRPAPRRSGRRYCSHRSDAGQRPGARRRSMRPVAKENMHESPGRDRRRRPVRPAARRAAAQGRHRGGRSSSSAAPTTCSAASAPACSSRSRSTCSTQPASATRLHAEGLPHGGIELCFGGARHRIDLHELTGGKQVMVYGQTEVTRDLMQARAAAGLPTVYEAEDVTPARLRRRARRASRYAQGRRRRSALECDFIAGCDGYHGVSRAERAGGRAADLRARLSVRLARRAVARRRRSRTS